ncbi:hypothetical protein E4T71_08690 [Streptococcus sp. WM07]|nr:hypothetical protein E4T71_08690 [Streptococcus sp. WM07]
MKTIVKASQQWNLFLEFLVGQILIILTDGCIYTLRQLILTITSSSSLLILSYLSSRIGIQFIYLIPNYSYLRRICVNA